MNQMVYMVSEQTGMTGMKVLVDLLFIPIFITHGNRLMMLMVLMTTGGLLVSNTRTDFDNVQQTHIGPVLHRQDRFTLLPRKVLPHKIGGEEANPRKLPITTNSFQGT